MNFKVNLFVIFSFLTIFVIADKDNAIVLDILYETYCENSKIFITKTLYPAYKNKFIDFIKIKFNPFGKANMTILDNQTMVFCEHGEKECYGNKVHACVLASTTPLNKQFEFINCTLSKVNISSSVYPTSVCANESNIDIVQIEKCANGTEGTSLLLNYGRDAKSLFEGNTTANSALTLPSISVNSKFSVNESALLVNNFDSSLCELLLVNSTEEIKACKLPSAASTTLPVLPVVIISFIFSKLYQ